MEKLDRIVVVFRVRVNPGMEEVYEKRLAVVYELASKSPGLLPLKGYEDSDGEKVYIIEWDSEESMSRWANDPVHQEAKREGREELYSWYSVQICREFQTLGAGFRADQASPPLTSLPES